MPADSAPVQWVNVRRVVPHGPHLDTDLRQLSKRPRNVPTEVPPCDKPPLASGALPRAATTAITATATSPHKAGPQLPTSYPFAADPGDHCETPLQAYQDIDLVLETLARLLKKPKSKLKIFDPFFCAGSMRAHLASLGYHRVINENVDWYMRLETGTVPKHDVLLTNPPYSGRHVERLLTYVSSSSIPAILLLPDYVHSEPYYNSAVARSTPRPMFLRPIMRYAYMSPAGLRGGRAIPVTPFESMWHLHLGRFSNAVRSAWQGSRTASSACTLYTNRHELTTAGNQKRQIARTIGRPNPKARKRARKKILASRKLGN
eukprot:m.219035 g.219035  ORF g.219035 m.219035 type:complete len:318 (+) comp30316_c0_seq1:183-1136(+)